MASLQSCVAVYSKYLISPTGTLFSPNTAGSGLLGESPEGGVVKLTLKANGASFSATRHPMVYSLPATAS